MKEENKYYVYIMGNRALAQSDHIALEWMRFCIEHKIVPDIRRVRKPKEEK